MTSPVSEPRVPGGGRGRPRRGVSARGRGRAPSLLLDDEEALAVALGLRVATATAVGGLEVASLSALSKLEHVTPETPHPAGGHLRSHGVHRDHLRILRRPWVPCRGCLGGTQQRMRFGYVDTHGQVTERHTEPLRLVHTGRRWYLVAFDLDRDDWRTFRLDRLSDPWITGMRSGVDPNGPVELVQRGVAIEAYTQRAEVTLFAPMDHVAHMIPATVGAGDPERRNHPSRHRRR